MYQVHQSLLYSRRAQSLFALLLVFFLMFELTDDVCITLEWVTSVGLLRFFVSASWAKYIFPRTCTYSTHNTDALLVSCIHPNVGISEQVISFAGQIAMQSTSLRYVPLSFTPSLHGVHQ